MLRSLAISWVSLLSDFKKCVSQKSVFTECCSVLRDFPVILPSLPAPWVPVWEGSVPSQPWHFPELLPFTPSLPVDSPRVPDDSDLLVSAAFFQSISRTSVPSKLWPVQSPSKAHALLSFHYKPAHPLLLIIRAHSHPPQSGTFPVPVSHP